MTEHIDPQWRINPGQVPSRLLSDGQQIPAIGLGTFGSDSVSAAQIATAVDQALDIGYRLIDCAACYENEAEIGEVFARRIGTDLKREELTVFSKVWNDSHDPKAVAASARKTLADLHLDYLDAYFVHWPFPNYHAPFARPEDRNPESRPYLHEEFMETWAAMERLVDQGLVKSLGTSNVTVPKLRLILRDAAIRPVLNEMELHPTFQQGELFQFCMDNAIQPVGYSPIGSPGRPERDKAPGDYTDTEMPEIVAIAEAQGVHPASVCIQWAVQRGQIPIPFSTNSRNIAANLKAACAGPLAPAEFEQIKATERNSRLIKGQVFLWPGSGDWLDLWDVDGTIPGWNGYESTEGN